MIVGRLDFVSAVTEAHKDSVSALRTVLIVEFLKGA